MRWWAMVFGLGAAACSGPSHGGENPLDMGRPDGEFEVDTGGDDLDPGGFVRLDADPSFLACDIWSPQCPAGKKCAPHASDPSQNFDGFACVDVLGERVPGDPCSIFGDTVTSSLDDCERGAWCFSTSTEPLSGTCLKHCSGSALTPYCPVATQCLTSTAGPPAACMQDCHPFDRPCTEPSMACVPISNSGWVCAHELGLGDDDHGSPCEFPNACEAGNICAPLPEIPDSACDGTLSCCARLCRVGDDASCPNAAQLERCLPYYSHSPAPIGYEEVGFCTLGP